MMSLAFRGKAPGITNSSPKVRILHTLKIAGKAVPRNRNLLISVALATMWRIKKKPRVRGAPYSQSDY
jgi:hypothetical protein